MPLLSPILKEGSKILLVGDVPGDQEEKTGIPFVGYSGQELFRMLSEAGLSRADCSMTTVFLERPPNNDLDKWCLKKAEAKEIDPSYDLPPIKQGRYIHPEKVPALDRLWEEANYVKPNLIIALGGVAAWATTGSAQITKFRGTVSSCAGFKVLPTYHPSYILRNWSDRPVLVADLIKAKRQSRFPEVRRPARFIHIPESLEDIREFRQSHIDSCTMFGYDIETGIRQITCISFAPRPDLALVIPFVDKRKPDWHYWDSLEEEIEAWMMVKEMLALPQAKKVTQNGLYDMQWLWKTMGIPCLNSSEDTMILHHAQQPELQKGLGFLGSIYTDEPAWKLMRKGNQTTKRDDS